MKRIPKITSAAVLCLSACMTACSGGIHAGAYVTVRALIPVSCLGVTGVRDHVYEIQIKPENNAPAPVRDTLQISEMGVGSFEITINEPGSYVYRLSENAGNDPEIQYDESVYMITVTVVQYDEETLEYSVSVHGAGKNSKAGAIEFRNIVRHDVDAPATLPVETAAYHQEETDLTPSTTYTMDIATDVQTTHAQVTDVQMSDVQTTGVQPPDAQATDAQTTSGLPETSVTGTAETTGTAAGSVPVQISPVHTRTPGENNTPPAVRTMRETASVTTPSVTTAVSKQEPATEKTAQLTPIRTWIENVLTGDRFPITGVLLVTAASGAAAVSAFLFKRKRSEEEENEE